MSCPTFWGGGDACDISLYGGGTKQNGYFTCPQKTKMFAGRWCLPPLLLPALILGFFGEKNQKWGGPPPPPHPHKKKQKKLKNKNKNNK